MTFIITCVFIALYYIRPFEIIESMRGIPILFIVGIVAGLFFINDIVAGRIKLFKNGTDQMMVGFYLAIGLSHVGHMYFGGASKWMQDFFPVFIGYFLVAHSINSLKRLKIFIILLICCTAFLAFEGVMEARNGVSYFGVRPLEQGIGYDDSGQRLTVSRIQWVGAFADPNDLAMAFVVVIPFLLNALFKRKYLIPLSLSALIIYGIFLTNSRGGLVALAAAVFSYFVLRFRSLKGLIFGICLAMPLFNFGPSRMGSMSASEESAYGRLEAWYAGFQMFKSSPIFGVGRGMFTDYHDLTAHNSLVLVFAELGIIGAFFFVGMFYFPLRSGYKTVFGQPGTDIGKDCLNSYNAIWSALIGIMTSMFFLSRSYVLLPYMLIGLSMSFVGIKENKTEFAKASEDGMTQSMKHIFIITILSIVLINVMIKVLL